MKPKFIIFDCDGVLVDTEEISCGVLAEEARKLGADLTNQEAVETFAGTSLSFVTEFIEERLGKKLPEDFEKVYRKRIFEEFEKSLQPIPGIHDVVKKLKLPFCVASNAPINKVEFNLKLVKLYPYFEKNIFSAYEVNAWKPDPTLFLTAAEKNGFHPSECIVVEDSPSGVKAAVNANMKILGFAKGKKAKILEENGATVISRMEEIFSFL